MDVTLCPSTAKQKKDVCAICGTNTISPFVPLLALALKNSNHYNSVVTAKKYRLWTLKLPQNELLTYCIYNWAPSAAATKPARIQQLKRSGLTRATGEDNLAQNLDR
jgi:hypothetical protein